MADEFVVNKWHHVFDGFFDLDGSKSVEQEDLEILLKKIEVKHGKDSNTYQEAEKAMKAVWEGLIAYDQDGDGDVSKEEWKLMWQAFLDGRPAACDWQKSYLEFMFKIFDVDGDNHVSEANYVTAMSYFNVPLETAKTSFLKMSDGSAIERPKFDKLWSEYFTSEKRDAEGNSLFGQLK